MAIVIEFQDYVQARRRRETQAVALRSLRIIDCSLDYALELSERCCPLERPIYLHRAEQLRSLRDYAQRTL